MLARKKIAFAPALYTRHRNHVVRLFLKAGILNGCLGTVATAGTWTYLQTGKVPYMAALLVAAFFYFLVAGIFGLRDQLRVTLLPYFSKRLGDADTFLKGRSLLWHSRQLDELAAKSGLHPISDFASGDDMVLGEKLIWFDPDDAIETVSQLQSSREAATFPPELTSDLHALRAALDSARAKGAQFCLLLREGSYASGLEMDRRKGSFF